MNETRRFYMIYKKEFLSAILISLSFFGCKDLNWDPIDPNPLPGGGGLPPPVTCNPPASPNEGDLWGSHLIFKNNAKYKPADKPLQRLSGIVPALVKEASDHGELSTRSELSISVAMRMSHEIELNRFLRSLYDPRSPNYRKFLTSAEFTEKFSPSKKEVEQVKNLLEKNGFKSVSVDANRFLIHAKGNSIAINKVFNTEIRNFKDKNGKAFYAPSYELQVPLGFAIQGVHGLDNAVTWHNHLRELPEGFNKSGEAGFTPAQINSAYSIPRNLSGAGQSIALFELDGYNPSDILGYEKAYGISPVPLKNILVSGATGQAGASALEVVLDIELITAVAPGAKEILVYEGLNSTDGVLATYNRIANDNVAKIVSVSWGASESSTPSSFLQSEATIFKQMAAQGQSIYVASGDSGAYDDGYDLGVSDPASQPYAVSVGGTQLSIKSDGSYDTETSWNTDGGGGGGISDVWTIPPYQVGLANSQNQISGKMRNVPDVSLNSDPKTGYSVYFQGKWTQVGGTSCAAPLWAAFIALVNEQRGLNGLPAIGFPNPTLYQLGRGPNYAKDFHDIDDESTNMYYPAVTGYDASTGWGTIQGAGLLDALTATTPPVPTPTPSPTATPAPLPTATPLPPCYFSE